ncbi:MAG: hypothetical protein AAF495_11815 [Pseudomonadota bacterium]
MKLEEIQALKGRQICMLPNGLEAFYSEPPDAEGLCGFKVPGETETHWVHHENLVDLGAGAIYARNGSIVKTT